MNEKLFDDLYNASEYFRISNIYEQIKERYMNDELDAHNKYTDMKQRKESPLLPNAISIIFGLFILLICTAVEGSGAAFFLLIGVFLTVGFPLINSGRCKKVTERYQKEADDWWYAEGGYITAEDEKNYEKAQRELDAFQTSNQHVLEFLPPRYRNYLATQYMALAVANCRADSLKEAINLYEEQLHRWELEQTAQSIAAYNAQIEENLANIYAQQVRTNRTLQNMENMELYWMLKNS